MKETMNIKKNCNRKKRERKRRIEGSNTLVSTYIFLLHSFAVDEELLYFISKHSDIHHGQIKQTMP